MMGFPTVRAKIAFFDIFHQALFFRGTTLGGLGLAAIRHAGLLWMLLVRLGRGIVKPTLCGRLLTPVIAEPGCRIKAMPLSGTGDPFRIG
jgi:hypothetical protein